MTQRQRRLLILIAVWLLLGGLTLLSIRPALGAPQPQSGGRFDRLVRKEGEVAVMVNDTDTAVARALELGDAFDAYVLEHNVYDGDDGHRYGEITFGVAHYNFEGLLRALKTMGTLEDESVSGADVTDEVVDLESRLANLEATQARLRTFLDMAGNITETFTVHNELRAVESEIGEVRGRINYLEGRSVASTVTVRILPFIPTPTPAPTLTPTPTPTPTPLPTPQVWHPGDTAQVAAVQLQDDAQGVADFFIYNTIARLPWLLFWSLAGLAAWRLWQRIRPYVSGPWRRETAVSPPSPTPPDEESSPT